MVSPASSSNDLGLQRQIDRIAALLDRHGDRHSAGGGDIPGISPRSTVTVRRLKNGSGGGLGRGSVIASATATTTDDTFTTSTARGDERALGVLLEDTVSGALGMAALAGVVETVKVLTGTTRYQFLRQSTTAGSAEGVASFVRGCFGIALTSRDATLGTVRAYLFGMAWGDSPLSTVTADVTVGNTVSETAILSQTITGGELGTTRRLRVTLEGTYLNNSGAGRTLQMKVKFGATTAVDLITGSITNNAAARAFKIVVEVSARGASNSQLLSMAGLLGAVSNAATGVGSWADASATEAWAATATGTAAEDSTADKTLAITVQHSAADAGLTMTLQAAVVERVG